MVVTTSSNKKYFQAISPSEDLQLGACAAILNIPVTHWQDMFFLQIFLYHAEINFFALSNFQIPV